MKKRKAGMAEHRSEEDKAAERNKRDVRQVGDGKAKRIESVSKEARRLDDPDQAIRSVRSNLRMENH